MPYAEVNRTRLYYEWQGPEAGPLLVLNNGILMNAATSWLPQRSELARECRVLCYDCRGQGASAHPPGPYSMSGHADDLAALLDALGIDTLHVAGISYGGEVAQAFALAYPFRVRSLFLADTVSEVGPELRLIIEGWRAAAALADPELFFRVTVPWNFSPAFIAGQATLLAAARARYAELDFAAVARLCDAFLTSVDFTARLSTISMPTRIVVGELDLLKGPAYAAMLHGHIPASDLHTIPGAGHAANWERPDLFNALLLDLVRRTDTRA